MRRAPFPPEQRLVEVVSVRISCSRGKSRRCALAPAENQHHQKITDTAKRLLRACIRSAPHLAHGTTAVPLESS